MLPFLAAIALFLLGYLGLVISIFPYLVPPSLTIWETAAAPASQIFMLIGTLVLLPMILGYTVLRLLAVPRQGARRRELSLSSRGAIDCIGACAAGSPPSRSAAAAAGPAPARSKARGTSGTRSGKRALMSAAAACRRVGRRPDHDARPSSRDVVGVDPRASARGAPSK